MAVDRARIEEYLPRIVSGLPGTAPLADVLRSSNLNQAERNELVRTLATDPHARGVFLAGEYFRTANDDAGTIKDLRADQKLIGQALQQALRDGAITPKDLADVADFRPGINSAQTLMSTMRLANDGAPNSGLEALSNALWDKGQQAAKPEDAQRYQAIAATGYLSDPKLQAAKFGPPEPGTGATPEQKANSLKAFEALVGNNDALANARGHFGLGDRQLSDMRRESTVAAGQLYVSNGKQLTEHYTGDTMETGTLAKFYKQAVFNPDTREARMRDGQPLAETVAGGIQRVAGSYIDAAKAAPQGSETQKSEMGKLGLMTAGVEGGITLAIKDYSDKITAHQKSRDDFAKSVGTVVGMVPVPGGKIAGAGVKASTDPALKALYEFVVDPPKRPDVHLGDTVKDAFERRAAGISQDALNSFRTGRSNELHDLYRHFNINPGGYRADASQPGDRSNALASASPDQLFDSLVAARKSGDPAAMGQALGQSAGAQINRELRNGAVAAVDASELAAKPAPVVAPAEPAPAVEERSRGRGMG